MVNWEVRNIERYFFNSINERHFIFCYSYATVFLLVIVDFIEIFGRLISQILSEYNYGF
ncbi:hypothetical protein C0J52_13168 [Blattella germanica]|nr:hypothetical protein C0J52_13168 [Blattella germanica]